MLARSEGVAELTEIDELGDLRLAHDELRTALREHGVEDPSSVRVAYLEPDGAVSVVPVTTTVYGKTEERSPEAFTFSQACRLIT